jgi:hypothetical protein
LLAAEWVRSTGFGLGLSEVVAGFLVGGGAGALTGAVAGLATWAAGPGAGLTIRRLAVTRGLFAAGACAIATVAGAAICAGLFGTPSPLGIKPGWETAAVAAVVWGVYGAPITGGAGFVYGVAIALLDRDRDPE